jgi:hypothetical protein
MTSPSPRNRRTTASSTRRIRCFDRRRLWTLVAGCSLSAASWLAAPATAADSSLEKLQQRSGDERWQQLRSKPQSTPVTAPLPAALSPQAPGSQLFNSARPVPEKTGDQPEPATLSNEATFEPSLAPVVDDQAFSDPVTGPASPSLPVRGLFDAAEDESQAIPMPARTAYLQPDAPAALETTNQNSPISPLSSKTFALRPITDIQPFFDYSPTGEDPCEHLCPLPDGLCPPNADNLCPQPLDMPMTGSAERYFPHLEFYWAASNLYHNPLYFSNPALERYGHVHFNDCVEPAFSMARFGAQFVGLPYQMALDCACRREYALGYYRPGDFAPKLIYQPPLNARAAGTAAAVYTGLFFLVP